MWLAFDWTLASGAMTITGCCPRLYLRQSHQPLSVLSLSCHLLTYFPFLFPLVFSMQGHVIWAPSLPHCLLYEGRSAFSQSPWTGRKGWQLGDSHCCLAGSSPQQWLCSISQFSVPFLAALMRGLRLVRGSFLSYFLCQQIYSFVEVKNIPSEIRRSYFSPILQLV